jgi:hypothetical protein
MCTGLGTSYSVPSMIRLSEQFGYSPGPNGDQDVLPIL